MAGNFKELIVWQKFIVLVQRVYELNTRSFPMDERFGLISQMRRAAVSVPSNLAEGQARRSTKEFVHFISNAEGSHAELETQAVIVEELSFIHEIQRMLNALRRKLEITKVNKVTSDE